MIAEWGDHPLSDGLLEPGSRGIPASSTQPLPSTGRSQPGQIFSFLLLLVSGSCELSPGTMPL